MTDSLNIWLPLDFNEPWHWRAGQDQGYAVTAADKAGLAGLGEGDVTVILPGQMVRIFDHTLPKMREQERLSAAGFAIEDQVATPLSEQHIVAPADDTRIAVIKSDAMARIQSALSGAGLAAKAMFADFDVVQSEQETIILPDRIITPGKAGYTMDTAWQPGAKTDGDIVAVMRGLRFDGALNLATGRYARRNKGAIATPQLLRIAAIFAVAGFVWLGWEAVQSRAKIQQADFIRAQISKLYTDYTGQAAPANPALSVTRTLKSGGSVKADILPLSAILFRAVETVPDVSIDTLQFDPGHNRLSLRLIYPRFESATELEQAVRAAGGTFQSGGVREQSGRLIGDAVLTLGGGGS
ncbi:MAG: type II secretion system protein GspL [Alphaproteobacteria bacterium]